MAVRSKNERTSHCEAHCGGSWEETEKRDDPLVLTLHVWLIITSGPKRVGVCWDGWSVVVGDSGMDRGCAMLGGNGDPAR